MSAPGFWEWIALAVIGLLIFGPERLPKMAQNAGKMIARFRQEAAGTLEELKAAAELDEFSGVADELRETSADLRRSVDLSGPIASDERPTKPRSGEMAPVTADVPPPFDPDTP